MGLSTGPDCSLDVFGLDAGLRGLLVISIHPTPGLGLVSPVSGVSYGYRLELSDVRDHNRYEKVR